MQPKYSAAISIQDLKRFTNVQYSREGSTLCLHRVKQMEMFQVIAASQGTNTGVEQHHTRFCREKKSDLLGPFQTQNTGTCLERAQTNAGFSQNSSKMLSRTKSTIVAAKSSFTLAPTSVWVSLSALGPAQPQRLLIPLQPPPSRVCCPHQPVPTSVRQIPAFWDGKGLPDRADVVTKQSNAQCLLLANSPISPFPCRSEGIGLNHTKDTGARAAPPKTNSLHKKMKESKSKRG